MRAARHCFRAALFSAALPASTARARARRRSPAPRPAHCPAAGPTSFARRSGPSVAAVALWYRAPGSGFDSDRPPGIGRLAATAVAASAPITGTSAWRVSSRASAGAITVTAYPDSVAISVLVPADRAAETVQAMTRAYFAPVLDDAGLTVAKAESARRIGAASLHARYRDRRRALRGAVCRRSGALAAAGDPDPRRDNPRARSHLRRARIPARQRRAGRHRGCDASTIETASRGREGAAPTRGRSSRSSPFPIRPLLRSTEPSPASVSPGPVRRSPTKSAATALDFLADYLFFPETGTVQRALHSAPTSVSGTFVTYHDPGVFSVTATGGDLAAARTTINAALAGIRTPLGAATFEAARRAFVYHILSDQQTAAQLADTFGWYTVEGNPGYAPGEGGASGRYFAAAASLTPEFVAAQPPPTVRRKRSDRGNGSGRESHGRLVNAAGILLPRQ